MQNPRNSLAHVYVIENTLGVVKVGIATNPAKRFRAITASSGLPIVQSHLSPLCLNYLADEKLLSLLPIAGQNREGNTICKTDSIHDEKGTCKVRTLGDNTIAFNDSISRGNPNLLCINESGLYALILRSNKPQAKPFRKWITSEVIPSIRKTGGYGNHGLITQVYELQRQVSAIQSLLPTNLIQSTKSDAFNRFSRDVESLKRFYSECTVNDVDAYLPIGIIGFSRTTHLYPAYVAWCEREGVRGVSLNYFSRTSIRAIKCLGWQGIHHDKTRTGKVIRGIRFSLTTPCDDMGRVSRGAANHG